MKPLLRALLPILCVALAAAPTPAPGSPVPQALEAPDRGFVSSRPGETWEHGLITGNGTIGASVLSDPLDETIVFSHERVFLPERDPVLPPHTAPRLFEIRRLILRGQPRQAERLAFDISGQESFLYPDPFVPAFDLSIRMDAEQRITDYARSVDFRTGVATVHWTGADGVYERRLFVSRADGVAVLRITGPAGAVNTRLELRPRNPEHRRFRNSIGDVEATADESFLTYRNVFTNAYPGSIHSLEGVASVSLRNGTARPDGSALVIEGADEVLLLLDIDPRYGIEENRIEETKAALAELPADYDELLGRHAPIHGELFDRMRLDLGGGDDHAKTTEQLIAESTDANPSRALIEKEFDAGRYNIISSVGELPPTLQGVWAGTYDPPWASDFTQNGNVPSAIASLLMGNMPELMLAYTSYMEEMVPYMEVNADRIFDARGIVLPSRSSSNAYNNALSPRFAGAFWAGGAAWAARFFHDYWEYTGDREFLAEHALPFMEKTAVFFEDYLIEGPDGKWMFIPTQSPENFAGNTGSQATYNATMTVAAAKELLRNLIADSRVLGVNEDKIPVWEGMLAKMPEYMINDEGAIKEWLTPALTDDYAHRHASHLYPLFAGLPEEIENSPELQAAFRRVIELKLERHWSDWERRRGYMSFGLVQLGQAATSLGEAELAYQALVPLINRYWLHNMASTHNYRSLFNMDISGGQPAVIIKMLVASKPGEIDLLPALPEAWPTGTIEGVLCRGQVEIGQLRWEPDGLTVSLLSPVDQVVRLRAPGAIAESSVTRGEGTLEETDMADTVTVSLTAGQEVTVDLRLE